MNDFDKYIKSKVEKEQTDVPDSVKNRIEQTLVNLPEKKPVLKKFPI